MRRIGVAIAGCAVVGVGLCMLVLPGPAFLVIPAGIAILATEFAWAKRWVDRTKAWALRTRERWEARRRRP